MEFNAEPPVDLSRIDVDTGRHTENDRASVRALVAHPFYGGVIRDLLGRDQRPLSIRTTLPTDRTERALWDRSKKQIRLRPEQEDGNRRAELIKWELLNGHRNFTSAGFDARSGPDHYADLVEQFEYGTAQQYAGAWREGDPVIFEWVGTLRRNLQEGSLMSARDWSKAIARGGYQHYRDAQERYLVCFGSEFLPTPEGASWLASRSGSWFRGSEQWNQLAEGSRARVEELLRPIEAALDAERRDLDDDIARTLAEARAKRSTGGNAPEARAEPRRERSRSPRQSRGPTRRIEAYVRGSDTYRERWVISYLKIWEDGTSRVERVDNRGNPLWVYFSSWESVRRNVAFEHRLSRSDVDVLLR